MTALVIGAGTVCAEGYQVNTLSTKQLGMGHAGVGMKLGAESMYFNPAGLGFMDKTLDLSASVSGLQPTCTATIDSKKYTTDCDMSTPFMINAAFSIYPNLKAGVNIYTPYGSAVNWTDNWPGAVLNQSCNLKVFTIQPTLAWRPLKNLSVGAGLMMSWGTVDLNKGLINSDTFDKFLALQGVQNVPAFGDICPASINLSGTTRMAFGANVGVLWEVNNKVNVGASFRTRMSMRVKAGDASVRYANEVARTLLENEVGLINQAQFTSMMPCPWVLSLGVAYKPVDRLTLALDGRLTGWHTYKRLDIGFLSESLQGFNQNIAKNYDNSWCFSLGAQYAITDRFDGRLGLMVDTTPVDKECYNPETPGMTKIEPTVGLSFRPFKGFSIDLAFMYIHGCGAKNASCQYTDLLGAKVAQQLGAMGLPQQTIAQMGFEPVRTFRADYKLHAVCPSIGVSYSF